MALGYKLIDFYTFEMAEKNISENFSKVNCKVEKVLETKCISLILHIGTMQVAEQSVYKKIFYI